jgi:hypothetical protein
MTGTAVTVAATVAVLFAATGLCVGPDYSAGEHRLPRDTRPVAYGLRLAPNYDAGSGQYGYAGQVEIMIAVDSITPNVTLNAADMQVNSVAVVESVKQTELEVDGYELVRDTERLNIYVASNLLVGRRYEVKITFQGYLRPDMTGFYRSTYTRNGTRPGYVGRSQFAPKLTQNTNTI